ncbi:MAG: hypothetical protein WBB77_07335 [Candidatus Nanopelagicales bacterium]
MAGNDPVRSIAELNARVDGPLPAADAGVAATKVASSGTVNAAEASATNRLRLEGEPVDALGAVAPEEFDTKVE